MSVQEAVGLLRLYLERGREAVRIRYGPEVVAVAEDIDHLLEEQLGEDTAYVSLWDEFERNPEAHTAELIGTLEAMIEADPLLARMLDGYLDEYHEATRRSAAEGTEEEETSDLEATSVEPVEVRNSYLTEPDTTERTDALQQPGPPLTDRPFYPKTESLIEHETVAGEGTYLYGNVQGSDEPVGRSIGVDTYDFGAEVYDVELENLAGLPHLLDKMLLTLENIPDVELERKQEIKEELEALKQQIGQGETADPEALTQHLMSLHELAPNVGETVLQALEMLELAPPVKEAVANVRSNTS